MKNYSNEIKTELIDRLKNLSETVSNSLTDLSKGKPVFTEDSLSFSRMAICKNCDDFNKQTSQCRRCGCFMSVKTKLKHSSCPIGKWGKDV